MKTILTLSLVVCGACAEPSQFLGSFEGSAEAVLTPDGATGSSEIVIGDVLVNGFDISQDSDRGPSDFYFDIDGLGSVDLTCNLEGDSDGSTASISREFESSCSLMVENQPAFDLDQPVGLATRTGNVLTIEVSGEFTGPGSEGAFSLTVRADFIEGTNP